VAVQVCSRPTAKIAGSNVDPRGRAETEMKIIAGRRHLQSTTVAKYKVVQIWPGQTVTCLHTNSPGHIWTTLYVTEKDCRASTRNNFFDTLVFSLFPFASFLFSSFSYTLKRVEILTSLSLWWQSSKSKAADSITTQKLNFSIENVLETHVKQPRLQPPPTVCTLH
jgi:hypothetical protein